MTWNFLLPRKVGWLSTDKSGFLVNSEKQKGVALVLVLLSLTLLASAGSYLIHDDHKAIRRVENQRDYLQAHYLAESGLQWVKLVLQKDGESSTTDHLNEPWNTLAQPVDVENGALSIEVLDAQSRFNINNLQNDAGGIWLSGLENLLEMVDQPPGLAAKIKDWIDEDANPTGFEGAEDDDYLLHDPPMRAANSAMGDISELLLVKDIDMEIFEKISPFLAAIPTTNLRINVNTCPDLLFGIMGCTVLPEGVGRALVAGRGEGGYLSVDEFIAATELASHGDVAVSLADVSSSYFLVNVTSSFGRIIIKNRYLLKRSVEEKVYVDIVRVTSVS
ncbi:MAG: hypothetical protein GKR95_05575 [Gammaproteobacteria bacterium]|nr:hypothetical protein [Gammaproteobacteria bacterium]